VDGRLKGKVLGPHADISRRPPAVKSVKSRMHAATTERLIGVLHSPHIGCRIQ